jgi:hypothetical protein
VARGVLEPYHRTQAGKHWVILMSHPYRHPYQAVPGVPGIPKRAGNINAEAPRTRRRKGRILTADFTDGKKAGGWRRKNGSRQKKGPGKTGSETAKGANDHNDTGEAHARASRKRTGREDFCLLRAFSIADFIRSQSRNGRFVCC